MDTNLYVVTYGELNGNQIKTVVVMGKEAVKKMASEFITVIPDDLEDYKKDIKAWKGKDALIFNHQDDDTFYFSATLGPASDAQLPDPPDTDSFHAFVSEYAVEDDGED